MVCVSPARVWIEARLGEEHSTACIAWEALRRDISVTATALYRHQKDCLTPGKKLHQFDASPWWYMPPPVTSFPVTWPPEVLLIRGLPGTGKTRLARCFEDTHFHVENDQFFLQPYGDLRYEKHRASEAFLWCYLSARDALSDGVSIVVANTFLWNRKLDDYYALASRYGATVRVLTLPDTLPRSLREARENGSTLFERIPISRIGRMRNLWEDTLAPEGYPGLSFTLEHISADAGGIPLPVVPYFCQPGLCPHAEHYDFAGTAERLRKLALGW
jgi:hypothetical protein